MGGPSSHVTPSPDTRSGLDRAPGHSALHPGSQLTFPPEGKLPAGKEDEGLKHLSVTAQGSGHPGQVLAGAAGQPARCPTVTALVCPLPVKWGTQKV